MSRLLYVIGHIRVFNDMPAIEFGEICKSSPKRINRLFPVAFWRFLDSHKKTRRWRVFLNSCKYKS